MPNSGRGRTSARPPRAAGVDLIGIGTEPWGNLARRVEAQPLAPDFRRHAMSDPGHPGQGRALGIARQSQTDPKEPKFSLRRQVKIDEEILDALNLMRCNLPTGTWILQSANTSGFQVDGRHDLTVLRDAVGADEIEHVITPWPDRFLRNSQADMLALVGLMAVHRIKVHTLDRSYNLGTRKDRIDFINALADAERSGEAIFNKNLEGLKQKLAEGHFPRSKPPFGTRRVPPTKHQATTELVYLPGFPKRMRTVWRRFLKDTPRSPAEFEAFSVWACQYLGLRYAGKDRRRRVREILTDPTYEGCYHVNRVHFVEKPHMRICDGVDLGRVHRVAKQWAQIPDDDYGKHWRTKFDLAEVARRIGGRIETLEAGRNLILVCTNPPCRRTTLTRMDRGLPSILKNGGRVIDGVYYQTYICPNCRKPVVLRTTQEGEELLSGYACGKCRTPSHWRIDGYPSLGSIKPNPGAHPIFKITCQACEHVQFLSRADWGDHPSFRKALERQKARQAKKMTDPHCACVRPGDCEGRCRRTRSWHAKGLSNMEIAELEGLRRITIDARIRRLGLKPHPKRRIRKFDRIEARRLWEAGCRDAEIARSLQVHQSDVVRWRGQERLQPWRRLPVVLDEGQLLAVYREGLDDNAIARRLAITTRQVRVARRRLNLPNQYRSGRLSHRSAKRLPALMRRGLSMTDIAHLVGVSVHALNSFCRLNGLRRRDEAFPNHAAVMKLYSQGATDATVALRFGIARSTVKKWRHGYRLPANPRKPLRFDPVLALYHYNQGGRPSQIAHQVGAKIEDVRAWLRYLGLPLRRRAGHPYWAGRAANRARPIGSTPRRRRGQGRSGSRRSGRNPRTRPGRSGQGAAPAPLPGDGGDPPAGAAAARKRNRSKVVAMHA